MFLVRGWLGGTAQLQAHLRALGPLIKADCGDQPKYADPGKRETRTHLGEGEKVQVPLGPLGMAGSSKTWCPLARTSPQADFPQSLLKALLVPLWVLNGVLQPWPMKLSLVPQGDKTAA